jgi:hypothetical protein
MLFSKKNQLIEGLVLIVLANLMRETDHLGGGCIPDSLPSSFSDKLEPNYTQKVAKLLIMRVALPLGHLSNI